jgi:DNA-directed RNA polymerase specialized sigma24 family protein
MISRHSYRASRVLTKESFEYFLSCLDTDREHAAQRYLDLRDRLIYLFEGRQCDEPIVWADEVINRVVWRLQEGEKIQQIEAYALGVARFALKEYFRHQQALISLPEISPQEAWQAAQQAEELTRQQHERERLYEAMRQCLLSLPAPLRELLLEYYSAQGREQTEHRRALAKQRGLTENALYLKIHRIREKLDATLRALLAQDESE